MLAGWPPIKSFLELFTESSNVVDLVAAFSFMTHFEAFHRGVIDSRDVLYFVIVVVFSLFTTGVIIRNHRAG
jgi:ABC-2 type transport system permease protein